MSEKRRSAEPATMQAIEMIKRVVVSPWFVVALGPLGLLGPRLLFGQVLFWGTPLLQFIPWRSFGFEVLSQGYLPLWNPWVGMGAPLLANYQSAFFYPLNTLLTMTDIAWGHGLLVMLHLLLSSWGMVALCRRLDFSNSASAIAGLSFGMSAYLVSRAGFFSINASASWLPWILWAFEGWRSSTGWKVADFIPASAFLWLQWLAGHAQTAWYSLLLVLAWILWRFLTTEESRSLRVVLRLAAPFGLAFLLAAPQLLPTLEYLANSQRATSVDSTLALTYSFWPWRLLELFAPGVFGHPAGGDYWGYANYWEDALYVGMLPLLLALGGSLGSLRARGAFWRLGRFLLAVAGLSFLFSLGKNTPVFPWLMKNIPTFNLFQAPTRWNLLLTLALPLLAAIGYERWQPAEGRALYWLRLGTAGAAAVSGGAWLAARLIPSVRDSFLEAFMLSGVWLLLAGGLALTLSGNKHRIWKAAALSIVLLDLLLASSGLIPMTSPSVYAGTGRLTHRVEAGHRTYLAPTVEYDYTFNEAFRFDSFNAQSDWSEVRDVGLPNTLMLDRVATANNFDPLLPVRYQRWMAWLAGLPEDRVKIILPLMDVSLASLAADQNGVPIYRSIEHAGRLRWFSQILIMDDPDQILNYMADAGFDPDEQILFESQPAGEAKPNSSAQWRSLEAVSPNQMSLDIQADGAGWLLISNVNFPGWRAELDGVPINIETADFLFQAVFIPAGSHTLTLSYQPLSIQLGFGMFGLGVLLVLYLFWVNRWR